MNVKDYNLNNIALCFTLYDSTTTRLEICKRKWLFLSLLFIEIQVLVHVTALLITRSANSIVELPGCLDLKLKISTLCIIIILVENRRTLCTGNMQ